MVASGLRHFAEWVGEGTGQPRLDEEGGEQLMHVQPGVSIALGSRPPQSPGTLYITSKFRQQMFYFWVLIFFSLFVMFLFGVVKESDLAERYGQHKRIETEAAEDEASEDSDSECTEELDLSKVTEMRLVLSEPSQLDALFDVFCDCAELNPDPNEGQDEENDWVFGDEQMVVDAGVDSEWHFSEEVANPIGHANGHNDLAHSVLELRINDDRFEDADESEQEAQRHPE